MVLNSSFSSEMSKYIATNNLIYSGHFKINNDICVRDWIDIYKLLVDKKMLARICDTFTEKTKNLGENILIVGVSFAGVLLASNIAFNSSNPFTYIIQKRLQDKFVLQEKNFEIPNGTKIIIVTDIIVTLKTIDEIIELIKRNSSCGDDDIVGIFSLFYRKIIDYGKGQINITYNNDMDKFRNRIYVINDEIDIEICRKVKEQCFFRKHDIDMYLR